MCIFPGSDHGSQDFHDEGSVSVAVIATGIPSYKLVVDVLVAAVVDDDDDPPPLEARALNP